MLVIGCIIAAVGLSSRVGQWKMMSPRQQGTILDTNIKSVLQFCSRIILITGYRGNELHERYANQSNIIIIHNPGYAQGLLTPVKTAVPVVQTEHCFLIRGDVSTPTTDIFREIWSLRNNDATLPLHSGTPGHPILVSKPCLMQAIQRPNVTNVCQALLMREHYSVEVEDAEIISDIDIPDNFITAKKGYIETQRIQLNDCVQISNPPSTLYHNDEESLILRKEEK